MQILQCLNEDIIIKFKGEREIQENKNKGKCEYETKIREEEE